MTDREYVPGCALSATSTVRTELPEALGTDGGLKLQVTPAGKLLHESVTVPVNPPSGAIVTVDVALLPGDVGEGESPEAETVKLPTLS